MNDRQLKAVLRNDFLAFARKAILEQEKAYIDPDRYLEYLATELTEFADGSTMRLLVNLPPRHLKTMLFSVCLSAWMLAHDPSAKIMVVTYSEQLAESIARKVRAILQADWFAEIFPTRIAKDYAAVMDFGTTAGGQLYAASFSGSITGRGADLIIIDDPHDIKDAGRPDQLERAIEIFYTVVMSRLNNQLTGKIVVIAHRIHDKDLSSRLLKHGGWRHIVLPMVEVSDKEYPTDYGPWLRAKGELLRPRAFSWDYVEGLRTSAHNPGFELLYQQDVDGLVLPSISGENFLSYSYLPAPKSPCVMSIDPNMTAGPRNAFSVVQIWRPWNASHCLINQWREQCGFTDLKKKVKSWIVHHQPSAVLIEQSANGHALVESLDTRSRALVHGIIPNGSKRARLLRNLDIILSRRILLPPEASWRQAFVDEFIEFPHGDYTDQVDATTQYLDFIKPSPPLKQTSARCIGVLGGPQGIIKAEQLTYHRFGRKPF
jgi:predicted phage terminase large subunit-like protein